MFQKYSQLHDCIELLRGGGKGKPTGKSVLADLPFPFKRHVSLTISFTFKIIKCFKLFPLINNTPFFNPRIFISDETINNNFVANIGLCNC